MVEHWVKYVRWQVIQRWRKRVRDQRGDPAAAFPYAFASREAAFPRIAGGVLWLVTSPRFGEYRLPPSLVARLDVREVVPAGAPQARGVVTDVLRHGHWVALAEHREGAYLPVNNALHALRQVRFRGKRERLPSPEEHAPPRGRTDLRLYGDIPGRFQQHRVVAGESVPVLEDYAAAVRSGRRVFLSYRWADFAEDPAWVAELAETLSSRQVSCWWDRWDVPQDQSQPYPERILTAILDDAIRQSAWFVALMRPGYVAPGRTGDGVAWARREWDMAGRQDAQRQGNDFSRVAITFDISVDDWVDAGADAVVSVPADASAGLVAERILALLPPVRPGLAPGVAPAEESPRSWAME